GAAPLRGGSRTTSTGPAVARPSTDGDRGPGAGHGNPSSRAKGSAPGELDRSPAVPRPSAGGAVAERGLEPAAGGRQRPGRAPPPAPNPGHEDPPDAASGGQAPPALETALRLDQRRRTLSVMPAPRSAQHYEQSSRLRQI